VSKYIAAIVFVALALGGFATFRFLSAGPGKTSEEIVFEVPGGKSFHVIAQELEHKGLITSEFQMRVLARLTHQGSSVKRGEYLLNRGMSPQQILSVLVSGKSIQYPVTFPEGSNIYEMAGVLEKHRIYKADEFIKAVHDPKIIKELLGVEVSSLEGYLYPETYNVTRYTPMHEFLAAMVQNFKTVYAGLETRAKGEGLEPSLPRHELVILASMVEKETGAPQERPQIASVFYNRLRKNMKLQSDPTTIYGLWVETGSYKQNITHDDLLHATAYNTYTVPRLPFGPIANPGAEALAAVMMPAHTEFLYFVSHNDGTHAFSKTYEEHQHAVRAFQLDPKAREGKSWRDLNKRK
jgi:UPF0755 protein